MVAAMWRDCGADVCTLSIAQHDAIFAQVSHLPHLLAYALVHQMLNSPFSEESFSMAAGGFADFSRIASSSPQMWHDIALANASAIIESIETYQTHLDQLKTFIKEKDSESLLSFMQGAKQRRDEWIRNKG